MDTARLNGKTAILYARASTQEQSTRVQIEQLEEFCRHHSITIIRKFSENVSGAKEHREQLEVILDSESMADLLVIREISRISRERDYLAAINKISILSKKYSIYVLLDDYFIEKGDIIDLGTGITMMVKLYGAADEREKIRDRTNTAKSRYSSCPINVYTGHKYIPFGLLKADNPDYEKGINTKRIWVRNPEQWPMVEKIFELKANGYSLVKISAITGISLNIVSQTLVNPRILYYIPKEVADKVREATLRNTNNPTPTKHTNIYKGKIFLRDTHYAMTHQICKTHGDQYRAKKGESGTIKRYIIDDIVKKTIIAMLDFFDLKKEELSRSNVAKAESYRDEMAGLMASYEEMCRKEEELNRKWLKAPTEAVERLIAGEMKEVSDRRMKVQGRIDWLGEEIRRIEGIDYSGENLVLTADNFQEFVDKYIRRIEVWHQRRYHHLIKVYVNAEYVPDNFYDYKMWEIDNYKIYRLREVRNPDAAQTIHSGLFSWDCKVFSLDA